MDNKPTRRLTATDARDKASECRNMARRVQKPEHRVMLEDMAATWDRLAMHLSDSETASSG